MQNTRVGRVSGLRHYRRMTRFAMINSRVLLVALIAVIDFGGASVASAQHVLRTGNDLIAACRVVASGGTPNTGNAFQVGICLGELEALNWLAPGAADERIRSCVPATITTTQMAGVVVAYLDRNSDRLREPFEGLALEALADNWPCPPPGWFGK